MMKILNTIVLFVLISNQTFSQEIIKIKDNFGSIAIKPYIKMYLDNSVEKNIESIQKENFSNFSEKTLEQHKSKSILWLKFKVENIGQKTLQVLFYTGKLFFIDLYQINPDGSLLHYEGGTFSGWDNLIDGYALPITLQPQQKATIYIRIGTDEVFSIPLMVNPKLYESSNYETIKNRLFWNNTNVFILYFFTLGFLICSIFIALFQYYSFRDSVVLYYLGVVLISAIMILRVAEFNLDIRIISSIYPSYFVYIFTFQLIFNYLYDMFFRKMLNLKNKDSIKYPFSASLLNLHYWLIIISLILVYFTINNRNVSTNIYIYSVLLISISFIYILYNIIKKSYNFNTYYQFVIYGFMSLNFCYLIAFFLILFNGPYNPNIKLNILRIPPFYICLGTVLEFLFFMTALNHRIKLIEIESLIKGQALERKRVSEDLHNNINSLLASIKIAIQSIIPEQKQEAIHQNLIKMIDNATKEVRNVSQNMVPSELEKKGLEAALNTLIMRLNIGNNIKFELNTEQLNSPLDADISFQLYMVCTELCQNIVKHSGASQAGIEVETTWEDTENSPKPKHFLYLFVWDNGRGFEKEKVEGGMGFKNIKHRAEAIGAEYKVISQDSGSTFFLKLLLNH